MNYEQTVIQTEALQKLVTEARRLAAWIATESESEYVVPNAHSWALDLTEVDNDIAEVLS